MTAVDARNRQLGLPTGRLQEWGETVDALLDRWSERLNPILVKEARQSLKSRLFLAIFLLVLILAWCWSFLGIAMMMPDIYFSPGGPVLLTGYVWILLFPLFVVIPFSAFHSLAAERDDGTYELISITTLLPRQIISGRVAVAVLQMLLFMSVLSPCIAFTYLLRGIDMVSIGLLLVTAAGTSMLLTILALFWATLSQARHVRVFLALILLIALIAVFLVFAYNITEILMRSLLPPYERPEFWTAVAMIGSVAASIFALLFTAATAQITIVSENRSTRLRVIMLAQQALLVGWGIWYFLFLGEPMLDALSSAVMIGMGYWALMGALMVAESPILYQRARRRLPQSFFGRALLTWLQPGPSTGYVFAIANVWALLAVMTFAVEIRLKDYAIWQQIIDHMPATLAAIGLYFTIYLGTTRLLVALLRRFAHVTPAVGPIVLIVVSLFACATAYSLESAMVQNFTRFTLWRISNPFMTLDEVARGGTYTELILMLLVITAIPILFVNLVLAGNEVRRLREQAPERVLAEEAAKLPPPAPPADPLA